ncbi:MAG: cadmium-translocating P-type ATPase [Ruminococcus sp.]|nr:cadmium-translocating P-type ATPase [Ruminococcus sp.]
MKHELILEGLDCAHCAAVIEKKIADQEEYSEVSLSFVTKELSLNCDKRNITEDIQQLVDSVEDGVTVQKKDEHHDDHEHEHHHETGKLKLVLLITAAALFLAAFFLHLFTEYHTITMILAIASAVLSGYDVVIEGVKSVIKLRIDETTLMTVAVVAAMVLGDFVEAAAVTVLFGFGEMLEEAAVEKSRRDIRKLADIRPDKAMLVTQNGLEEVLASDVKQGALIEIAPHTRVPIDGVIVEGETTLDASSLTGESAPVPAAVGTELLSGMLNNDSAIRIKTTKDYSDSAASRIVKLVEDSSKNKGNHEKLITKFARIYTPAVMILAMLIAVIPSLITGEWALWIKRALTCLVAACPCSIVISVPLSYFAGIGAASKNGILIKGGRFVEVMAKISCIAFDKTGTLTDNHISVTEIKSTGKYSSKELLQLAASVEKKSSHPIAKAIIDYANDHHISILELSDYTEKSGHGVEARYGDRLISCCKPSQGAGVEIRENGEVIGCVLLSESVRKEAPEVLQKLRALSVKRLCMLTGDKKPNADAVASKLSLDGCYAELLPEDKVGKIEELIDQNGMCAFVGDGINDAPVLSRSSCGIAMGLGSEAAIESADMVLSSGTLSALPKAVSLSRSTINTVKANITFSLLVKAVIIVLAALGMAPMWLAVFADTGVCVLCVLNAVRLIRKRI